MTAADVRAAGERVEALLTDLGERVDAATLAVAEDLVRTLVELYGRGLERVMAVLVETGAAEPLKLLVGDDLVAALLIVHDLHPLTTVERVRGALEKVCARLGLDDGGVELLGFTAADVIRLRLRSGGKGCPATRGAMTDAIERAVAEAAPEISRVEVDAPRALEPPLLSIGRHPPDRPVIEKG